MAGNNTIDMVKMKEKITIERQRSLQALLKLMSDLNKDAEQSFDIVEESASKLLEEHVNAGGDIVCQEIDLENADRFEELLMFYHVPFYGIEATQKGTNDEKVYFFTRDVDEEKISKVVNHMDFELRTRLGWIGLEDFMRINENKEALKVNVSEEDLSVFADHVFNKDVRFTIEFLSEGGCDIYFLPECQKEMEKCIKEMADDMGIEVAEKLASQKCILDDELLNKILLNETENHIHDKYSGDSEELDNSHNMWD